tara:strand:- start:1127 stop:1447 length:321 start_codon:yes stop_codon:yes gene_type:complete
MKHRERLLETVIFNLLRQLQYYVDEGKYSPNLINYYKGDVWEKRKWTDTCDDRYCVSIELNWSTQKANIKATAFPIVIDCDGEAHYDHTGEEELFLDLSMEKDENE